MDDDEFHDGVLRNTAAGEFHLVVEAFERLGTGRRTPGDFTNRPR
jgi:hypothetical protein